MLYLYNSKKTAFYALFLSIIYDNVFTVKNFYCGLGQCLGDR